MSDSQDSAAPLSTTVHKCWKEGDATGALSRSELLHCMLNSHEFLCQFPSMEERGFSGEGEDICYSMGLMTSQWASVYRCGLLLAEYY